MSLVMSSPPRQPFFTPFTPTKPSPLSFSSPIGMGDENIPPAPIFASSPIQSRPPASQFKRPFQPNPLIRSPAEAREQRRNQFLQKIREQREQKTLDMRGGADEMQRTLFLAERRRREEYQRREALLIDLATSYDDEMADDTQMGQLQMHPDEAALVEEMMAQEEQELISMLDDYRTEDNQMADASSSSHAAQAASSTACPNCASDELFEMNGETICFSCGWGFRS